MSRLYLVCYGYQKIAEFVTNHCVSKDDILKSLGILHADGTWEFGDDVYYYDDLTIR